jgi:hypothetical protein
MGQMEMDAGIRTFVTIVARFTNTELKTIAIAVESRTELAISQKNSTMVCVGASRPNND